MDEKRVQTVELQVKADGLDDIEKQLKRIRKLAKKTARELEKMRIIKIDSREVALLVSNRASMKVY